MTQWKTTLRRAAPWALLLAVLAGLAAVRGLAGCYNISYEITNGDFQNYNPVRHLLAGQAPYKDFTVYLGAGELYSVGALLLVLGNSFGRSMFAASFCTWFYFELLVLAVCAVVMGTARRARALACALCAVCFAQVQGWMRLPWLSGLLTYAADSGNSARMIRSAALPLAVLSSLALLRAAAQRPAAPAPSGWRCWLPPLPAALVPAVAGALVPWSNDMGAAMYLSVSLGYGLFLLRLYRTGWRRILLRVGQYIAVSCVSLGVAVLLISRFHPIAWLLQTRGVSSYQNWYYGATDGTKLCYLTDYIPQPAAGVCLALAAGFAVGVFACRSVRSAALAAGGFALCLGMQLWNLLYCLLSGSPTAGPIGGAQALLAVLVPALAVRGVLLLAARWPRAAAVRAGAGKVLPPLCAVLGCCLAAVGLAGQVQARLGGHEGLTHMPSLGGWIGDQAEKLTTEQTLAGDARLFGTYASALEVMTGQLQPTGTDYIIHVLGDRQRLAYLTQFQQGDFDLAVTPSPKAASYERWSRNANWWFYRELYRWYAPVDNTFQSGGMHLFWQKTGVCNDLQQPVQAVWAEQDGVVTLTLTAEDPEFCGVADVTLNYRFDVAEGYLLRGGLHSYLTCTPVTEDELWTARGREAGLAGWQLPTDRGIYQIPVTIANGVGVVTFTPQPADAASFTLESAVVEATYTDWEYFFE